MMYKNNYNIIFKSIVTCALNFKSIITCTLLKSFNQRINKAV